MLGLSKVELAIIGAMLAIVLTGGGLMWVFHKGEVSGSAAVTTAVERKTVKTLDDARISKERTDGEVQRTPYGDRVDGLR